MQETVISLSLVIAIGVGYSLFRQLMGLDRLSQGGADDELYIWREDQEVVGPIPQSLVLDQYVKGKVVATDYGWRAGMYEYRPLWEVLAHPHAPAGTPKWLLRLGGRGQVLIIFAVIGAGIVYPLTGGMPLLCWFLGSLFWLVFSSYREQRKESLASLEYALLIEPAIRKELNKPAGLLTKADLEAVTKLYLHNTLITDAGLKEVAKLKQLEVLCLNNTKITDIGLKDIAELKCLTDLWLGWTVTTDAGLKDIAKLEELSVLGLQGTAITDTGLKEIAGLPKLTNLWFFDTLTTVKSLEELKSGQIKLPASDPNLQVSYQYQDKWRIKSLSEAVVVVGRPSAELAIDIDLSPDTTVSRMHARIWLAEGECWIEDSGSRYGTQVNGTQITGCQQLQEGDLIAIGETTLRVDASDAEVHIPPPPPHEDTVSVVQGMDVLLTIEEGTGWSIFGEATTGGFTILIAAGIDPLYGVTLASKLPISGVQFSNGFIYQVGRIYVNDQRKPDNSDSRRQECPDWFLPASTMPDSWLPEKKHDAAHIALSRNREGIWVGVNQWN